MEDVNRMEGIDKSMYALEHFNLRERFTLDPTHSTRSYSPPTDEYSEY